ncbi:hypothetical protein VRK_19050 [Vibrio sp. MEBiC08052]|nr:hypothetical protein VRK_19050 [Vibrio sp. MEBiC08052]
MSSADEICAMFADFHHIQTARQTKQYTGQCFEITGSFLTAY